VESVENSKTTSEFSTLSTALGNPAKTKAPDFHISTAPAATLWRTVETIREIFGGYLA